MGKLIRQLSKVGGDGDALAAQISTAAEALGERVRGRPAHMPTETSLTDLTRTIQLAVAPVFLLMALGTLLAVLSTRLGRIVDRARSLAASEPAANPAALEAQRAELALLSRRRGLINYAITSTVLAALQVCLLISLAFIGFMLKQNFSLAMAALFLGAMASYILALVLFLREILLAVASTRLLTLPPR